MGKTHSPLLGFNNNVRHKNRVFHIQTEDSGIKHPHIITHLFMDGGRILKSVKKSYAEHVGTDGMQDTVRQMMKEQHKAMFIALRDGQFDAVVDEQVASKAKYDADTSAKKAGKSISPAGAAPPAAAVAAPADAAPSPGTGTIPGAGKPHHPTVTGLAPAAQPAPAVPSADVEAKGVDTKRESVAPMPAQAALPADTQKMSPPPARPTSSAPPPPPRRPSSAPPPKMPSRPARSPSAPVAAPVSAPMSAGAPPVSDGAPRYPTPGKQRLVVLPELDDVQPNTMRDPEPPPPMLDIDLNNSPQPPRMADADLFRSNDLPPPPQNLLKKKELTDRSTYRGAGEEERHAALATPRRASAQAPAAQIAAAARSHRARHQPRSSGRTCPRDAGKQPVEHPHQSLRRAQHKPEQHQHSRREPSVRHARALRTRAAGHHLRRAARQGLALGDDLVTDKSLDEVILSYLAEDLEQAPKKK